MRKHSFVIVILLGAFLLLLGACGSQSPSGTSPGAHTLPGAGDIPGPSASSPGGYVPVPSGTSSEQTDPLTPFVPTSPQDSTAYVPATYPTADPSEPATEDAAALARRERAAYFLEPMDEKAKLLQLFIVPPQAAGFGSSSAPAASEGNKPKSVAGLWYQPDIIQNRQQLMDLTQAHQSAAGFPLFICANEEGGRLSPLAKTVGITMLKSMFTYRGDGPVTAMKNARTIAEDLRTLGFNLNMAPVADVWSQPDNKIIGERAYSDHYERAAALVAAAVRGFHEEEMICVLKHFPGMGQAREDAYAPRLEKTLAQLRQQELLPFKAGIEAGADIVMVGQLILSSLDAHNLAYFSYEIVTELLREELGFEGPIMTDNLDAITPEDDFAGEACLKALLAGCDLLLCPATNASDLEACVNYLLSALEKGLLSAERLDESVLRILELKLRYGLIQ